MPQPRGGQGRSLPAAFKKSERKKVKRGRAWPRRSLRIRWGTFGAGASANQSDALQRTGGAATGFQLTSLPPPTTGAAENSDDDDDGAAAEEEVPITVCAERASLHFPLGPFLQAAGRPTSVRAAPPPVSLPPFLPLLRPPAPPFFLFSPFSAEESVLFF